MSAVRQSHVAEGNTHPQQQQQQQSDVHQQQVDPRLLSALPAPALRRVLHLASTSSIPALCLLCCVSKGMRTAAEAAAPPMDITVRKPTRLLLATRAHATRSSSSSSSSSVSDRDADRASDPRNGGSFTASAVPSGLPPTAASTAAAAAASTPAAEQRMSLRKWLSRHGYRVRGLTVKHHGGPTDSGHDLLLAITNSAAAAAAPSDGGGEGEGSAAASGAGRASAGGAAAAAAGAVAPTPATAAAGGGAQGQRGAAEAASSRRQLPVLLERLHLRHITLSPPLVNTLVKFDQLQVLVLTGSVTTMSSAATQQQLLQALSQLKQLQKLALHLSQGLHQVPGDMLLHSMPRRLAALDLKVQGGTCSSSSLAHLEHLTSLRLHGVDLVAAPDYTEQQQGVATAAVAGRQQVQQQLGGLQLSQHQQQQQGQKEEEEGIKLAALSMRPTAANSWFAVPSVEALELVFDTWHDQPLTQLAACRRLRELRVLYNGYFPDAAGVSALTQLSRLRLETWALPEGMDVSSMGAELADLEQLQVLEVCFGGLELLQPRLWLPKLRRLEKFVVLVSPGECHSLGYLKRLAKVIFKWHNKSNGSGSSGGDGDGGSSSDSSEGGMNDGSSSGGGGGGVAPSYQAADSMLQGVELLLWSASGSSWEGAPPAAEHHLLQQAAAGLAAALPWLEVTAGLDTYTCPCWTGEGEEEMAQSE